MNLRERRFTCHEIPTKPPNNIERQPLLVLAVLAEGTRQTVSMAELADGMFMFGSILPSRPCLPTIVRKSWRSSLGSAAEKSFIS